MSARVTIAIDTALGRFVVEVDPVAAPLAAGTFLAQVDRGMIAGTSVYRIVTEANQPPETQHRIEVIQWGRTFDDPENLPFVAHELTTDTGLVHKRGALSMARRDAGTNGFGFVVGMGGDLDSLNTGGGRNPDGLGFTVFGQVVDGWPVLEAIFARAEPQDRLQNRIAIHGAMRM